MQVVKDSIGRKNKELVKWNLYQEQQAYEEGDLFFKLAFMSDKSLSALAAKVL